MIYNKKDEMWKDEAGMLIPRARITPLEKQKEAACASIVKQATEVSKRLAAFKEELKLKVNEVYLLAMASCNVKVDSKGNYTIFSFDRSIKIEVSVSDRITFDDLIIKAAQEKFNEFLRETVESKFAFVNELITDAFSTSRGSLDAKKVMGLLKYTTRISHPLFLEACELIQRSIVRPDSKTYYRVFVKNEDEQYEAIELNFSNV